MRSPLLAALVGLAALQPRASLAAAEEFWPADQWDRATAQEAGVDEAALARARDYALTAGGAGHISRRGRVIMTWGDTRQSFDLKSTTKSFGSIALGLAIKDGLVRLEDRALRHHPTFGAPSETPAPPGWLDSITLLHLASQTAGFEKPGGSARLQFPPGTRWDYSDSGPNWLAECLTLAWRRDVDEVMFERVFTPLGIARTDLRWRQNAYRPATIDGIARREFGSGIQANVDALARIGLLMLREGRWRDREILTGDYVRLARRVPPGQEKLEVLHPETYGRASSHYGLLWWTNSDGSIEGVPLDTYWSWGLGDSLIAVFPALEMVVARAGDSWPRAPGSGHYEVLKPFLGPIGRSLREPRVAPRGATSGPSAGPPPSPVIREVRWAPVETVIRRAEGSDNWPVTWGDDDALYTAYGDGRGFEPFVDEKLSLGLARLRGEPPGFQAENLRAPTLEKRGDGAGGQKASGLLMVDGVLYLWARNAANSQLAWSEDHGATWTWAPWRFTTSFGCPAFLNFGRGHAGAVDDFVYTFSPDTDTAYRPADRMVLARVPRRQVRERGAYEFFARSSAGGPPVWTRDIAERGAVLEIPGRCSRSQVTWSAGLGRFLWVVTGGGEDSRFAGRLAIYDSAAPWGPWTTAFSADPWDIGPGETASFPAKWMSADGRTAYLVFSGQDCFSVRRAEFVPAR